ncbi:MAG TPA: hypothetical protein VN083_04410, partial [Vicinamibacteria bacterium]|nr:hypothetical protein [Vicinamibacteria bacterium]
LGPIRVGHGVGQDRGAVAVPLHFEGGQKILSRLGPTPRDPEARQTLFIERFGPALRDATRQVLGTAHASSVPSYDFSFPKAGHLEVRIYVHAGAAPLDAAAAGRLRASLSRDLPRLAQEALETQYGVRLPDGAIRTASAPRPSADRASPLRQGPSKPSARHVSRAERLGPGGDIHMVRFRIERGIEYVAGLPIPQQQEILGNAAAKAFPGLREAGFRPQVQAQQEGAALLVRVTVPHAYLWDRDLIPSPTTQAQFANEVYRLGGQLQNRFSGEILPVRPDAASPASRPGGRIPVADRAASKTLARETMDRLGRLAPAALRTGRMLLRWAERLLPTED